jgi:hypothetical protein
LKLTRKAKVLRGANLVEKKGSMPLRDKETLIDPVGILHVDPGDRWQLEVTGIHQMEETTATTETIEVAGIRGILPLREDEETLPNLLIIARRQTPPVLQGRAVMVVVVVVEAEEVEAATEDRMIVVFLTSPPVRLMGRWFQRLSLSSNRIRFRNGTATPTQPSITFGMSDK